MIKILNIKKIECLKTKSSKAFNILHLDLEVEDNDFQPSTLTSVAFHALNGDLLQSKNGYYFELDKKDLEKVKKEIKENNVYIKEYFNSNITHIEQMYNLKKLNSKLKEEVQYDQSLDNKEEYLNDKIFELFDIPKEILSKRTLLDNNMFVQKLGFNHIISDIKKHFNEYNLNQYTNMDLINHKIYIEKSTQAINAEIFAKELGCDLLYFVGYKKFFTGKSDFKDFSNVNIFSNFIEYIFGELNGFIDYEIIKGNCYIKGIINEYSRKYYYYPLEVIIKEYYRDEDKEHFPDLIKLIEQHKQYKKISNF
jgi:hypothetical protein